MVPAAAAHLEKQWAVVTSTWGAYTLLGHPAQPQPPGPSLILPRAGFPQPTPSPPPSLPPPASRGCVPHALWGSHPPPLPSESAHPTLASLQDLWGLKETRNGNQAYSSQGPPAQGPAPAGGGAHRGAPPTPLHTSQDPGHAAGEFTLRLCEPRLMPPTPHGPGSVVSLWSLRKVSVEAGDRLGSIGPARPRLEAPCRQCSELWKTRKLRPPLPQWPLASSSARSPGARTPACCVSGPPSSPHGL